MIINEYTSIKLVNITVKLKDVSAIIRECLVTSDNKYAYKYSIQIGNMVYRIEPEDWSRLNDILGDYE